MQVSLDRQVGAAQRPHQSLPQTVLVLQDLLQMTTKNLQHLEPLSYRTRDKQKKQCKSERCGKKSFRNQILILQRLVLFFTLTEVKRVCDVGLLLLHLQQLHLQLQLKHQSTNHPESRTL